VQSLISKPNKQLSYGLFAETVALMVVVL